MHTIYKVIGLICFSLLLSACAKSVSPNSYQSSEVGVASKVVPGVIMSKRAVSIDGNSGAGGLAGAGAGAAAGSTIGGSSSTSGNIIGAIGGAVVGGLIGNAADKAINHHQGYEYIIRLKNGSAVSVVQAEEMKFEVNQRVLVVYGAMTRIIPDDMQQNKPAHG